MTIPLPEPAGVIVVGTQALRGFTADQMRAAILAERERCAAILLANAEACTGLTREILLSNVAAIRAGS